MSDKSEHLILYELSRELDTSLFLWLGFVFAWSWSCFCSWLDSRLPYHQMGIDLLLCRFLFSL